MKLKNINVIIYLSWFFLSASSFPALAQQGDAKRGQKVFEVCSACHAASGAANEVGPSLRGVFGRKAGTLEDFRYSPAMKRSGITWDAQTLAAFIAEPQKVVPANRMPYDGLPDARARADLLAYLMQQFK